MKLLVTMKEVIVGMMMEEVDLVIKIPATLPFTIMIKVLIVMIEV